MEMSGVLYKPENFDKGKKYPLIFNYYEKLSQNLHKYLKPDFCRGNIDIPTFVSNGYLVFTPDIFYKMNEPGNSAFEAVYSATNKLVEYSWVDSTKIGLQGHSFGGFETNYIITRTDRYAAACSAAGVSDFVLNYELSQSKMETGQYRMESNLWNNVKAYLKNSPILYVDKILTPVLLQNNKLDDAVSFYHGLAFFKALRRLGKKAWLLQYDGEYHDLHNNRNAADFTIRSLQFFNHYLKNSPPPSWMTVGRPAQLKGIDDKLELDPFKKIDITH
jgi:dipeptidyl aminopeptidase/acylaminoacyl peptidase